MAVEGVGTAIAADMKRDARLRRLSSEHHHALVLSRALIDRGGAWTPQDGAAFLERFTAEIEPHFQIEERLLLPALRGTAPDLVARTESDHAWIRAALPAVQLGDGHEARALGQRLADHVRFEERILFPAAELALTEEQLDELGRAYPGDE